MFSAGPGTESSPAGAAEVDACRRALVGGGQAIKGFRSLVDLKDATMATLAPDRVANIVMIVLILNFAGFYTHCESGIDRTDLNNNDLGRTNYHADNRDYQRVCPSDNLR